MKQFLTSLAIFIGIMLSWVIINFKIKQFDRTDKINTNTCINTCTPYGLLKIEDDTCICSKDIVRRKLYKDDELISFGKKTQ